MNDTSLNIISFCNFKMDERSSTDLFLNYSGRDLYKSSYSGPQEFLEIRGRGASRDPKPFEGEGFASIPPKSGLGGQNLPFCPPCNHNSDGSAYNYSASQSQAWLTPLSAFLVSMETFCISTGQKLNWHKIYCNFLLGRQVLVQSFSFFLQNLLLQKLAKCSLFFRTFILLLKTVNLD